MALLVAVAWTAAQLALADLASGSISMHTHPTDAKHSGDAALAAADVRYDAAETAFGRLNLAGRRAADTHPSQPARDSETLSGAKAAKASVSASDPTVVELVSGPIKGGVCAVRTRSRSPCEGRDHREEDAEGERGSRPCVCVCVCVHARSIARETDVCVRAG